MLWPEQLRASFPKQGTLEGFLGDTAINVFMYVLTHKSLSFKGMQIGSSDIQCYNDLLLCKKPL